MKKFYCEKCGKEVAKIIKGSLIKKETVFLCGDCMFQLQLADSVMQDKINPHKTNSSKYDLPPGFEDIFGGWFNKK